MSGRYWRLDKQMLKLFLDPRTEYSHDDLRILLGLSQRSNTHRFIARMVQLGLLESIPYLGPGQRWHRAIRKLYRLEPIKEGGGRESGAGSSQIGELLDQQRTDAPSEPGGTAVSNPGLAAASPAAHFAYECPDCHRTTARGDCCQRIRAVESELAHWKQQVKVLTARESARWIVHEERDCVKAEAERDALKAQLQEWTTFCVDELGLTVAFSDPEDGRNAVRKLKARIAEMESWKGHYGSCPHGGL